MRWIVSIWLKQSIKDAACIALQEFRSRKQGSFDENCLHSLLRLLQLWTVKEWPGTAWNTGKTRRPSKVCFRMSSTGAVRTTFTGLSSVFTVPWCIHEIGRWWMVDASWLSWSLQDVWDWQRNTSSSDLQKFLPSTVILSEIVYPHGFGTGKQPNLSRLPTRKWSAVYDEYVARSMTRWQMIVTLLTPPRLSTLSVGRRHIIVLPKRQKIATDAYLLHFE